MVPHISEQLLKYGKNKELYRICIDCEPITRLHLYNIAVLLESFDLTFAII